MNAPLRNKPELMLDAMAAAVAEAQIGDRPLLVEAEAARLIAAHPEGGMSHGEARDALSRLAMNRGVTVSFGA